MSSSKLIHILAIESSCDDTSVALVRGNPAVDQWPTPLSWSVQSQWNVHERFGGVVPELASRAHLKNIVPCIQKALQDSKLELKDIDAIAATHQPGLVGCLLIGHTAAKTLSFLWSKPLISCHHIHAHLASAFIDNHNLEFPFLAAVVSGGHTSLYEVKGPDHFEEMGVTLDDALGEAFDKGAKLLGLAFPGGPEIDRLSSEGNSARYKFGKVQTPELSFSFSGLKSELHRLVQREGAALSVQDAAASYQEALLNHLFDKLNSALEKKKLSRIAIVGGVARNRRLRLQMERWMSEGKISAWYAPRPEFCTDNAVMVGFLAYRHFLAKKFSDLRSDVYSTARPPRRSRA